MTLEVDASPASPGRSLDLRVSAKPFTATRDGFSPTRGSGRSPPTGQLTSPRHASRCRCPTGRRSRKPIAALSPDSRYRRPGEIRGFGVTIRLDNRNERCDDPGTAKSAVEFIDSVMKAPSKDLRIVDFSALVGFDEPLQMVDRYLHRLDVGFVKWNARSLVSWRDGRFTLPACLARQPARSPSFSAADPPPAGREHGTSARPAAGTRSSHGSRSAVDSGGPQTRCRGWAGSGYAAQACDRGSRMRAR